MSGSVKEWLPRDALDTAPVRQLVAGAVEAWSRKWFATGGLAATGFEAMHPGAACQASGWRVYGSVVALAAGAPAMIPLAGLALGAEPGRLVLSEVDRDIIGRFTTQIAADLALSLEGALGIDPSDRADDIAVEDALPDDGLLFTITNGAGAQVLEGAIPAAALVAFLKSTIPSARRPRSPISRLGRAIGATPVQVEARLGATTLPLGDLADLAPGDVLMLDRSVAAGAGLALFGSERIFADGAIADREQGIALLLSPQDRET
jgi:flagellar motor switch/type III secretory pathway protein FliN